MAIKQTSVFVENRPGRVYTVTEILAKAGINIKAVSIADSTEYGIIRVITTDAKKAAEVLRNENFIVKENHVTVIKLLDKEGSLADAIKSLYENNINIEYMYAASIFGTNGTAYFVLRTDDYKATDKILKNAGFETV